FTVASSSSVVSTSISSSLSFYSDTVTADVYTLSLHDALPICRALAAPWWPVPLPVPRPAAARCARRPRCLPDRPPPRTHCPPRRSEEHTSELQSRFDLVCRLLLERKKH